MLYFNRKEQNQFGTFKMMVLKVRSGKRTRNLAQLIRNVPIEPDGSIIGDPEVNFLVTMNGPKGTYAMSLNSDNFFWEINDPDVETALATNDMLGTFIVDVVEETPSYIFFELAVMLDKNLNDWIK